MEFLVISGLSGAGLSQAAGVLEDLDFYCVDNMPVALISQFAELCLAAHGRYERIAIVADSRQQQREDSLVTLSQALERVTALGIEYNILFLEASTDTIVKRYKETRRRHPLERDGADLTTAVERERVMLAELRSRAEYIIDTSALSIGELSRKLSTIFTQRWNSVFTVNCSSFGFKYAPPIDADLVFDVRFLPNPYYIEALAPLTGLDEPVRDYLRSQQLTDEFLAKLYDLLDFLIPYYVEEGKHSLNIAIGCTGGRHRSVYVASLIAEHIATLGYRTNCNHRDYEK